MKLSNEVINNIEIRLANEGDINDILNVEYDAFDKEICEERSVFLERISEFEEGFLIILYNKKIIGYISSEIWNYKKDIKEEDFKLGHSIIQSHNINGDELYISVFGILKEVRGMGLGNYIFDYFLEYISNNFKNIKSVILLVSSEWKGAVKIYKSKGFEEISIIKDFFNYVDISKDRAGIIMRKSVY